MMRLTYLDERELVLKLYTIFVDGPDAIFINLARGAEGQQGFVAFVETLLGSNSC